jgi:8-oxo-dGTP pyrophosphatase MutT (NUDIX family)
MARDDDDADEDARAHIASGGVQRAAVFVPLLRWRLRLSGDDDDDDDADDGSEDAGTSGFDVLLQSRASTLRAHASEVSFPGGKFDRESGDARDVDTALRESEEEVGLTRADVDVYGWRLPVVLSRDMISVRPIVGEIINRAYSPVINADEVAEVFTAPLEMFLRDDARHRFDDWAWPNAERAIRVHYFDYDGRVIWGLTAAILIRVASRVYGREPEFQEKTDEGVSVWDVYGENGAARVREPPRSSM